MNSDKPSKEPKPKLESQPQIGGEANASPDDQRIPFAKWPECHKAIRQLKPPVTEDQKTEFLNRLRDSEKARPFAFRILCLPLSGTLKRVVQLFEQPLLEILGERKTFTDLTALETLDEVAGWVRDEMSEVRNRDELKSFAQRGDHYWIFLHLMRCHQKKAMLVAGLQALGGCLADASDTSPEGTMAKVRTSPNDSSRIVKALIASIPDKGLPKRILDLVFALSASASVGEEISERLANVETFCKNLEHSLEAERAETERLNKECARLDSTLVGEVAAHEATRKALEDAEVTIKRQAGLIESAREEARNGTINDFKGRISHRLENIRLFADRPSPDGESIVELIGEIENAIQRIEKREDT